MRSLFGADIEIGKNLLEYHTVEGDRQAARESLDRALAGESFVIEEWAGAQTRDTLDGLHATNLQPRVVGACAIDQVLRGFRADGSLDCWTPGAPPGSVLQRARARGADHAAGLDVDGVGMRRPLSVGELDARAAADRAAHGGCGDGWRGGGSRGGGANDGGRGS